MLVLLPLGISRGIISSVQEICQVHGRPALQQAMDDFKIGTTTQLLTSPEGTQQLLERLTLGSGWQGRLVRTAASPFLPSTSQMMVRLQELVEKEQQAAAASVTNMAASPTTTTTTTTLDSHVLVAAVDGFFEGFLQDKKDTFTTMGLLAYAGIVGLGLGVDYSYRRASDWNDQRKTSSTPSESSSSSSSSSSDKQSDNKGILNIRSIQKRLGLSQSRANQEVEDHLEEQYRQEEHAKKVAAAAAAAQKAKEESASTAKTTRHPVIPPEEPLSIRDTLHKAQLQVGEMTKWILKGKQQADPYFRQALDVAGTVKDEMEDQAGYWFRQAKEVILDEENQEKFQEQWKGMVKSIQDMTPTDKSLGQMTKDMEDILRQAKKRLTEEDVQEMRKDLESAIGQAKERIVEEKKRAKVDERLEDAKEGIRARLEDWWNDRKK